MKRAVVFYRTSSGCPFENFLDSLPGYAVQKITWVLSVIEELDNTVELFFKKADCADGIMECHVRCEDAVFRILSFFHGRDMIVVWGGILVKFQNMLTEQLKRVQRYRHDFLVLKAGT